MNFVTVGGVTLHYRREGLAQGTPLLFLNSLGTDLRIWQGVSLHLVDHFPLIRYDLRGHGLSDVPPGPYTIADHANDLVGLLAHLQLETVILAGISVGGIVAMDFAARFPARTAALVLCDTTDQLGTADYWNERIAAIKQKGMEQLADSILDRWFAPGFAERRPAAYRGYRNLLLRAPVEGYIGTCAALRDVHFEGVAEAIDARTLVLCGAEDVATPPQVVRALAEKMPNGHFTLVDGAGHLPCVERPAVLASLVDAFLKESVEQ